MAIGLTMRMMRWWKRWLGPVYFFTSDTGPTAFSAPTPAHCSAKCFEASSVKWHFKPRLHCGLGKPLRFCPCLNSRWWKVLLFAFSQMYHQKEIDRPSRSMCLFFLNLSPALFPQRTDIASVEMMEEVAAVVWTNWLASCVHTEQVRGQPAFT